MMLIVFCLIVPAVLLVWQMCAVAGFTDDQMEAEFKEMEKERQNNPIVVRGDAHAG